MQYDIIWFEIAAFIASLIAWPVIRRNRYLRLFPLLLAVVVGVESRFTFFKNKAFPINSNVYNIQIPVQHLIYMAILYFATERPAYRKFLVIAACIFVPVIVLTILLLPDRRYTNVWGYCAGSTIIIIGAVAKFYEMLQDPTEFNFLKNPFFYLLFAFLLFNLGTMPYFAMGNWLYSHKQYKKEWVMFNDAMSILNYILYSTYTIVFLWMRRMKGSY